MQCAENEVLIARVLCIPQDPSQFAGRFYAYGLGFIGAISILFIIIGAYMILMSRGDVGMVEQGKSYIFYAIFGLFIALFGYLFIQIVVVDVLRIPGFS